MIDSRIPRFSQAVQAAALAIAFLLDVRAVVPVVAAILVLAALQNQVTVENAADISCRLLAEGANGPTMLEADDILHERGIFVLPDILGNAGGVTVSYFEWVQGMQNLTWTLEEINGRLKAILLDAFQRTLERARRDKLDMRTAALIEVVSRVTEAKLLRGVFP